MAGAEEMSTLTWRSGRTLNESRREGVPVERGGEAAVAARAGRARNSLRALLALGSRLTFLAARSRFALLE